MAKQIEVLLPDGTSSYYLKVEAAWKLVREGDARWVNGHQIQRKPDNTLKATWCVRRSGYAGPLVRQIDT